MLLALFGLVCAAAGAIGVCLFAAIYNGCDGQHAPPPPGQDSEYL